jgi:hypothetical protein
VLGRVMHPSTSSLFDRLGLRDGFACIDVGCGGGDATLEIARRVAPDGQVIGVATSTRPSWNWLAPRLNNRALAMSVSRSGTFESQRPRSHSTCCLPILLAEGGFEDVGVSIVQPVGTSGEVKLLTPITMQNIVDAVLEDGLATREELEEVTRELYAYAADPKTVAGTPRVFQSWGRRPAA